MRFGGLSFTVAALLVASAAAVITPTSCNADNCFRALRHTQIPSRVEEAQSFCSSFAAVSPTNNVPIPTYITNSCKDNQHISSACACLLPAAAPTKTIEPCAEVSASWAAQAAPSMYSIQMTLYKVAISIVMYTLIYIYTNLN